MRSLLLLVALIVIAPKPANSQPSVLPLVSSASGVEEVGYIIDGMGYGLSSPILWVRIRLSSPYYGYGYGYAPYYEYGYRRWR